MKKYIYIILVIAFSLCIAAVCFGCTYKFDVNTMGGDIEYDENTDAEQLLGETPTKEGFIFGGWFADETFKNAVTVENFKSVKPKTIFAKWITADTTEFSVRTSEARITDSGRANQKMDIVDFASKFDLAGLIFAGYTEFKINMKLDIREIDDGYQYIFLYRSTKCESSSGMLDFFNKLLNGTNKNDPGLLASTQIEHGSGYENTTWEEHIYDTSVAISDLDGKLYLRYGASGSDADTWQNKNVVLTVTPIK